MGRPGHWCLTPIYLGEIDYLQSQIEQKHVPTHHRPEYTLVPDQRFPGRVKQHETNKLWDWTCCIFVNLVKHPLSVPIGAAVTFSFPLESRVERIFMEEQAEYALTGTAQGTNYTYNQDIDTVDLATDDYIQRGPTEDTLTQDTNLNDNTHGEELIMDSRDGGDNELREGNSEERGREPQDAVNFKDGSIKRGSRKRYGNKGILSRPIKRRKVIKRQ
jgi:hypothetical protein